MACSLVPPIVYSCLSFNYLWRKLSPIRTKQRNLQKFSPSKVTRFSIIYNVCTLPSGDWHIAYLLLYSPLRLEKLKEEEEDPSSKPPVVEEEPMDTAQSTDDKPTSS